MATTPLQNQLYPFSTEDSKAIPLDVIRPLSFKRVEFLAAGVAAVLTIPADWVVGSFYSNVGCFVQFNAATLPNPPASDIEYDDTLWIPPNSVVVSTVLPGAARVVSLEGIAGYLLVQHIQKWAGIALRVKSSVTT